ncbi:MAG: transketolase C-terminal domain-containing protein [Candidatus Shapirobacteria bacterium]
MKQKSIRDAFGQELLKVAAKYSNIVVVSANLAASLRVKEFARLYPERFFEVGVAEQNATSVAAGLSLGGKIPFLVSFACFSPYLTFGQIRQSICLNKTNVKIIGSHAGLSTGPDGAVHQALEDIALMRALPKMKVFSPLDFNETKKIVRSLAKIDGPCYLRLSRPPTSVYPSHPFKTGEAQILKRGSKMSLVGHGPLLAETINYFKRELAGVEIINCPTLKPLDKNRIAHSAGKTKKIITLEDHQIIGGLGSAVAEIIAENKINARLIRIGMPDKFGQSARDYKELWEKYYWQPLKQALDQD